MFLFCLHYFIFAFVLMVLLFRFISFVFLLLLVSKRIWNIFIFLFSSSFLRYQNKISFIATSGQTARQTKAIPWFENKIKTTIITTDYYLIFVYLLLYSNNNNNQPTNKEYFKLFFDCFICRSSTNVWPNLLLFQW